MMKRLVLFDIGGVLLELHISRFFVEGAAASRMFLGHPGAMRLVFEHYKWEENYHNGTLSSEDFFEILRAHLDFMVPIEKIAEIYRRRLGQPIQEMIALKKRLGESGITVGLFSNTSQEDTQFLMKAYPEIYETFGGPKIFSYRIGSSKPNRKMYEMIQGFDDITLIEDTPRNLVTAKEFGWKGLLYPDQSAEILFLA